MAWQINAGCFPEVSALAHVGLSIGVLRASDPREGRAEATVLSRPSLGVILSFPPHPFGYTGSVWEGTAQAVNPRRQESLGHHGGCLPQGP